MEELPPPRFCVKLTQVGSRYEGQDIENFKLDNGVFIPTTLAGETRLYGTPVSFEMEIINGAPQWSLEASAGKTIIKVSASTLASAVALLRDRLQYAGRLTRDVQKKKYNASSEYLYDAFGLGCATDRAVLMGTGEGSLTKIPIDAFRCSWQSAFEPPEKSFTETLVGRVVTTGDGRRGVIVREGTRVDRDGDSKDDIAIIGREGIVKMRSSDVRENLLPATLITSTRSAYSLEKHGFVVAEEDVQRFDVAVRLFWCFGRAHAGRQVREDVARRARVDEEGRMSLLELHREHVQRSFGKAVRDALVVRSI